MSSLSFVCIPARANPRRDYRECSLESMTAFTAQEKVTPAGYVAADHSAPVDLGVAG